MDKSQIIKDIVLFVEQNLNNSEQRTEFLRTPFPLAVAAAIYVLPRERIDLYYWFAGSGRSIDDAEVSGEEAVGEEDKAEQDSHQPGHHNLQTKEAGKKNLFISYH